MGIVLNIIFLQNLQFSFAFLDQMKYDISYHVCVIVDYRLSLDPTWAETGDRYMLKLFRDYLFHQVSEDGRPWLDMSHVVQCLNKLDTGAPEKVSVCEI